MDSIAVRKYGNGGPLIALLHGGPGAVGSMRSLAMDLSNQFRVLEPLQRQGAPEPLSARLHIEDMSEVLPGPVGLVGWSWGAMLGLSFASLHPSLVRCLVLVGCGTYDEAGRHEYRRRIRQRLGPGGRAEYDHLVDQTKLATDPGKRDRLWRERARLALRAQAVDPIALEDFDEPGPDPLAEADERRCDAQGAEETWADVLRLQAERIEPQRFSAITTPVLMLHGDSDPHPGEATAAVLRRYISHFEYVELNNCGHTPWIERAARQPFLALLRNWLVARAGPIAV